LFIACFIVIVFAALDVLFAPTPTLFHFEYFASADMLFVLSFFLFETCQKQWQLVLVLFCGHNCSHYSTLLVSIGGVDV